jgi:hypothetical protein
VEVVTLGNMRPHANVVELLGVCVEGDNRCSVFLLMPMVCARASPASEPQTDCSHLSRRGVGPAPGSRAA